MAHACGEHRATSRSCLERILCGPGRQAEERPPTAAEKCPTLAVLQAVWQDDGAGRCKRLGLWHL